MLSVLLVKEGRLLWRDPYALLVLFVMPVVFVLIMSLSLQQAFSQQGAQAVKSANLPVYMQFETDFPPRWQALLSQLNGFDVELVDVQQSVTQLQNQVLQGEKMALIRLPRSMVSHVLADEPWSEPVVFEFSPTAPAYVHTLLEAAFMKALTEIQFSVSQARQNPGLGVSVSLSALWGEQALVKTTLSKSADSATPTSVQQSVPAWLVFAMFFIVIPLASTLLIEMDQGTLARLHTYPLPVWMLLLGKLIPYLGVNFVQALLMFATGIWLVPLFGGEALQLNSQAWLLLPTLLCVSLAAISFALLIAVSVRTHEQASTLGGLSNLVMAALGGVMVPVFVMPPMMQTLAGYSPMNWGLDAFLSVLLRGGYDAQLGWAWLKLLVLALGLLSLATWLLRRRLARAH
ncbi:MAG: ABC transporter permease [Thiomicrospira sp.]